MLFDINPWKIHAIHTFRSKHGLFRNKLLFHSVDVSFLLSILSMFVVM
jgi:hypothetical protein